MESTDPSSLTLCPPYIIRLLSDYIICPVSKLTVAWIGLLLSTESTYSIKRRITRSFSVIFPSWGSWGGTWHFHHHSLRLLIIPYADTHCFLMELFVAREGVTSASISLSPPPHSSLKRRHQQWHHTPLLTIFHQSLSSSSYTGLLLSTICNIENVIQCVPMVIIPSQGMALSSS